MDESSERPFIQSLFFLCTEQKKNMEFSSRSTIMGLRARSWFHYHHPLRRKGGGMRRREAIIFLGNLCLLLFVSLATRIVRGQ